MRVFGCQLNIAWEDREANYERVRQLLGSTAIPAGSLVALPEMFSTGFSMNLERTLEEEPSETERFLAETARERGIFLLGGVVRPAGSGKGANEAVGFGPDGGERVRYRKNQLFTLGREHESYDAGEKTAIFQWEGVSVAPLICYDLRFPECFRQGAARGAQLFVVVANWPEVRVDHWVTLLRARAIENLAYVVGVNRCGSDPKLNYTGRSMIVDPHGVVVADAGAEESLISADLDVAELKRWREYFPALRDMRGESVESLSE